jgi:hypothetical protein
MKKIINGEAKKVYEVTISIACCFDDNGEGVTRAIEKALRKEGIIDYEITFSSRRVKINLYNNKDLYYLICILDGVTNDDEESKIRRYEISVANY